MWYSTKTSAYRGQHEATMLLYCSQHVSALEVVFNMHVEGHMLLCAALVESRPKVIEAMLTFTIVEHLRKRKLIKDSQHRFSKGLSCLTAYPFRVHRTLSNVQGQGQG